MSEIERDRRIDSAWRAASREEPPPALDAAIGAAARRAVDAAPGPRRNKHWWYPLAAAATVAVLAVSIAQLTPPEQVAPTIVADMAVAPREAQQDVERRSAAVEEKPAAPPVALATPPPAQVPAKPAPGVAAGTLLSERARVAAPTEMKKQALQAKRESSPQDKLASAAPETASANTAASAPASAPVVAPRSEPFPAAPAADSRRDVYQEERPATVNAPAGAATAQAPQSRIAAAKVARTDEVKAKDASARSVEEWIKRIRDLKNDGRLDEAAKELAAFRAAYGERADALLPADLRQIKTPAK